MFNQHDQKDKFDLNIIYHSDKGYFRDFYQKDGDMDIDDRNNYSHIYKITSWDPCQKGGGTDIDDWNNRYHIYKEYVYDTILSDVGIDNVC